MNPRLTECCHPPWETFGWNLTAGTWQGRCDRGHRLRGTTVPTSFAELDNGEGS